MKYSLTDSQATESAIALYQYLTEVMIDRRLLFGQQNGSFRSVSSRTDSDVRQLTGTLPAIVGIDSLAITGYETTTESPEKAMEMAVSISEKATAQGCILVLSVHMPNFSGSGIIRKEDGTYDFTLCDYRDTKDMSGDCAHEILPGGKYEEAFHAYLDLIAQYAKHMQEKGIALLFRPWQKSNASHLWWGAEVDSETIRTLYRLTRQYLLEQDVHNLIYVYTQNGPITSSEEYQERYPGDDYADILAIDQYDTYHYKEKFHKEFYDSLYRSCEIVSEIAVAAHKLPAIAETGIKAAKDPEETDMNGILEYGNPVRGHGWFKMVARIAVQHGMPYYMVWGNYDRKNAYLPYVTADGDLHELAYEFLDLYHWEPVIFANAQMKEK